MGWGCWGTPMRHWAPLSICLYSCPIISTWYYFHIFSALKVLTEWSGAPPSWPASTKMKLYLNFLLKQFNEFISCGCGAAHVWGGSVCVTSFPLRWYPYSDSRFDTFCTLTASLNGVASPISPLFAETWNPTDKNKRTCKSKGRAPTLKKIDLPPILTLWSEVKCVKLLYSLPSLSVTNVQSDLHNEPPIQMIFFFFC